MSVQLFEQAHTVHVRHAPSTQMPNGKYQPVELDEFHAAPCELCPKDLSFSPRPLKVDCPHCGCRACRLMDLTQDQLEVPNLVVVRAMPDHWQRIMF